MEPQQHLQLAPPLALGFVITGLTLNCDHSISHQALGGKGDHLILGLPLITVEHMDDWTPWI